MEKLRVAGITAEEYIQKEIEKIRETVGDSRVLLGLSGGVDSSVCAAMLSKAIGERLTCVLVDHGLMRKNEVQGVIDAFAGFSLTLISVNAEERFLAKLAGITSPESKRKVIGEEFIRVFEEESTKAGVTDFLAQGTIYPDIVESDGIKSHHNVGGLPEKLNFKGIIEPLASLYKDEVRVIGRLLGLPDSLVNRQPFPGPGLAVRCIGELTKPKLDLLREVDAVFREELDTFGIESSQSFAVLTDTRAVGNKDGVRTYGYVAVLRAVKTLDFMNASIIRLPYELLEKVSDRVMREIDGISRVLYDVTSKPPGTIEFE